MKRPGLKMSSGKEIMRGTLNGTGAHTDAYEDGSKLRSTELSELWTGLAGSGGRACES